MADILRRYTDVLSLMDIIRNGRLTLPPPSRWYDQNDIFGLELYRKSTNSDAVYALCFAGAEETAHHWQIYAGHSHGLCIKFDKNGLIDYLDKMGGSIIHGPVVYCNLKQVREMGTIESDMLPFLKRSSFKAENEYRIVARTHGFFSAEVHTIQIPLNLIEVVTFSPSLPKSLGDNIRDMIREQSGCGEIKFSASRMNNNESWRDAVSEGFGVPSDM